MANRKLYRLSTQIFNINKNIHYICLMNLQSKLEIEFKKPLKAIGKDFKNEYTNALASFNGFDMSVDEKYEAIKGVLQKILDDYSDSKAKTKGGRVARVIAKILSFIIPYFKAKK